MNQTFLARQVKVSQQFISKLLKGERRPKWVTAKQLAIVTHTFPQLWMEGDTEEMAVAFNGWAREQRKQNLLKDSIK